VCCVNFFPLPSPFSLIAAVIGRVLVSGGFSSMSVRGELCIVLCYLPTYDTCMIPTGIVPTVRVHHLPCSLCRRPTVRLCNWAVRYGGTGTVPKPTSEMWETNGDR